MPHVYETDGAAIYLRSFATIRAEANLARFTPEEEVVAVRMIHAAGMVGLEDHCSFPKAWPSPPAPHLRRARRSSVMCEWCPKASPAPACPPTTRGSSLCKTPLFP